MTNINDNLSKNNEINPNNQVSSHENSEISLPKTCFDGNSKIQSKEFFELNLLISNNIKIFLGRRRINGELIFVDCKKCKAPCLWKPEEVDPRNANLRLTMPEARKEFDAHGHTPGDKKIDQILSDLFDHYRIAHNKTIDQTLILSKNNLDNSR